jgi:hypothetical protein
MCYCEGSCIYSLKLKQALFIERGFDVFNIHSLKVPVTQNPVLLHGLSWNLWNTVLSLQMQMQQFCYILYCWCKDIHLLWNCAEDCVWEISSVCFNSFHIVFPTCRVFCVSCDSVQQNLLLKTFLCICPLFSCVNICDSSVTIVIVLWDGWSEVWIPAGAKCVHRLWGPPSLLFHGYQEHFTWRVNGQGMRLTTHLHRVPRLRIEWSCTSRPCRCLNCMYRDSWNLPPSSHSSGNFCQDLTLRRLTSYIYHVPHR